MQTIDKKDFSYINRPYRLDGLVFLGCGGEIDEWINGIIEILEKKSIATKTDFEEPYIIETTGGRTDLVFEFANKNKIDFGKLAIWRIKFGGCSWISDYVVNYASHHKI